MTIKTKLNVAAENFSNSRHGNYFNTVINAFAAGSEWTLKYLSEQGGKYREFYLDENSYAISSMQRGCSPDEDHLHVIDHQALLASEAKYQEQCKLTAEATAFASDVYRLESECSQLERKLALAEATSFTRKVNYESFLALESKLEKATEALKTARKIIMKYNYEAAPNFSNRLIELEHVVCDCLNKELNSITLDSLEKEK